MADKFKCPHCNSVLQKSAAASVLGESKGHIVMGGPQNVTCPACGGDIDSQAMIAGEYDVKSGCFIATAVYRDMDSPEVKRLERFRDRVLASSTVGRGFIRSYYRFSPPVAGVLARKPRLLHLTKWVLDCIVKRLERMRHEKT